MMESPSDLGAARARVAAAYDAASLESAGTALLRILANHLQQVESRDAKVLNWQTPTELVSEAKRFLTDGKPCESVASIAGGVAAITKEIFARGQNMHHPHYVGHQVPAPVPLAGLFDFVGSVTNQVMAIYEMGPWATAVEHAVVDAVGEQLGFAALIFGVSDIGRDISQSHRTLGTREMSRLSILGRPESPAAAMRRCSLPMQYAHYSVTRSAGILGLGTNQIVPRHSISDAVWTPVGWTSYWGNCDRRIRRLSRYRLPLVRHRLVRLTQLLTLLTYVSDTKFGCTLMQLTVGRWLLAKSIVALLDGIECADTVVCDAHKMMFMPALCAMLFYRNPEHRLATFHQDAPYLFDPLVPELAEYDSGVANLECTKRAAAFGVWGVWSLLGPQIFADMVDVTIDTALRFYEMLEDAEDFETLHVPQCNIVAFRYLPANGRVMAPENVDEFQLRLRRRVIESGEFYLVQSRIDGRPVLRTTIMNPLTTPDDLRELMECLRRQGRELLAGQNNAVSPLSSAALAIAALPDMLRCHLRSQLALIHLLAEIGELCGGLATGRLL